MTFLTEKVKLDAKISIKSLPSFSVQKFTVIRQVKLGEKLAPNMAIPIYPTLYSVTTRH